MLPAHFGHFICSYVMSRQGCIQESSEATIKGAALGIARKSALTFQPSHASRGFRFHVQLFTINNSKLQNQRTQNMITLECNYSKKLGLPGYSSHQFAITLRTEIADLNQVQAESARLYKLLTVDLFW
jgi:hypothetical protein